MASVADMETQTQRAIYDGSTRTMCPDPDDSPELSMTIPNAIIYMEGLSVQSDYTTWADKWSAMSLLTDRTTATPPGVATTYGATCTLISATHAVAATHSHMQLGATVYFLTPAGDAVSSTVAEIIVLSDTDGTPATYGDLTLIRFTANPSAALARLPICTDASLIDYAAYLGPLWLIDNDMDNRLRKAFTLTSSSVWHANSSWNNTIGSGSGRPAVVALDDGELIITGTLWSSLVNHRTSSQLAAIQTQLDLYTETFTTMAIPDYSGEVSTPAYPDAGIVGPVVSFPGHDIADVVRAEVALLLQ